MSFNNAKIKYYPNGTTKVSVFNYPRFKDHVLRDVDSIPDKYDTDNPRNDNIRRAKDKIFDIAYLNADLWKWMVTLTLSLENVDRYDEKAVRPKIRKWLNNSVNRKNLRYLLIPEYHKDKAIHFHGFINDCDFKFVFSGLYDKQGREVYNIVDFSLGFTTAVQLDNNKTAVCKYITKYITKDCDKIFGQFYFAGGDIEREVPFEYIETDYEAYDVPEHLIPNTDIKVKYAVMGVFEDD